MSFGIQLVSPVNQCWLGESFRAEWVETALLHFQRHRDLLGTLWFRRLFEILVAVRSFI